MINLVNRNRRDARRAVLAYARERFPDWEVRGEYKDPRALERSFRRRLDDSQAFRELISDKRLNLGVISGLCCLLVDFYHDPDIPRVFPPEWQEVRNDHIAQTKKVERELRVLAKAVREASRADCHDLATELEQLAARRRALEQWLREVREYHERTAPPGRPILRGRGALKRSDTTFAERAEQLLSRQQPVPFGEQPWFEKPPHLKPFARYRVIAALMTDFYKPSRLERVRKLLLDAKRRAELERERWRAEHPEIPHEETTVVYPHPSIVPWVPSQPTHEEKKTSAENGARDEFSTKDDT